MSSRNLQRHKWFEITSEEQFKQLLQDGGNKGSFARVQTGKYQGPGRYMLLQYSQRCPRGCCYDSVNELLSTEEAQSEVKEQIEDLKGILGQENEDDVQRFC